jgi:hypothetical protein
MRQKNDIDGENARQEIMELHRRGKLNFCMHGKLASPMKKKMLVDFKIII